MSIDEFSRFDSAPAMLVAGIRRHHGMSDAQSTIARQWDDFRRTGMTGDRLLGVYCGMSADGFEFLSGVEVEDFEGLPADAGRVRIPAQDYAVFEHVGPISELGSTWQRIWKDWLPGSGRADAETPPFEVYGPRFDPDTGEGGLEIWFPVRVRSDQITDAGSPAR